MIHLALIDGPYDGIRLTVDRWPNGTDMVVDPIPDDHPMIGICEEGCHIAVGSAIYRLQHQGRALPRYERERYGSPITFAYMGRAVVGAVQ